MCLCFDFILSLVQLGQKKFHCIIIYFVQNLMKCVLHAEYESSHGVDWRKIGLGSAGIH